MPESVTDRPTKSHEYIFLMTKSANYFYDADAVREPQLPQSIERARYITNAFGEQPGSQGARLGKGIKGGNPGTFVEPNPSGRNLRTVWTIATVPYSGAHFATFPPALVERCIRAGTAEQGACPVCGKQWEREVDKEYLSESIYKDDGTFLEKGRNRNVTRMGDGVRVSTLGWRPTCAHDTDPVPATVFDPFVGSGTTVAVAQQLGRRGVGIDLSLPYLHLARERTGAEALERWKVGKLEGSNGKGASLEDLPMFKVTE